MARLEAAVLARLPAGMMRPVEIVDAALPRLVQLEGGITGRPADFAATLQAIAASACWRNWGSDRITPHDGAVREGHPAIAAILSRTQSASSLKLLLTSPVGFVLRYGLGLKAPEEQGESLTLDGLAFGSLIHEILQEASPDLSADGIAASLKTVAARWSARTDLPPHVIWQRTLERAREAATTACAVAPLAPGARTFAEVPFGDPTGGVTETGSSVAEPPNCRGKRGHLRPADGARSRGVAGGGHRNSPGAERRRGQLLSVHS